jgi:hypothetical protein
MRTALTPRRTLRSRRVSVLLGPVVGGAVLLALTGCSGDSGKDDASSGPTATVSAAETPTPTESTAASKSPDGAGGTVGDPAGLTSGKDLGATMSAAMKAAGSAKFALVAKSSGQGSSTSGTGAIRFGDDPAMQVTAALKGQNVKVRLVDQNVYVNPGQAVMGKQWVHLDTNGGDQASTIFGGLVSSLQAASDVSKSSDAFAKASSFKPLGAKEIRGETAHGYRMKLDEAALKSVVPEEYQASRGEQLTGATATYTVYLNDKGEPVRVTSTSKLKAGSSVQTVDYTDWGVPVTIEAPPADQVIESSQLG